MTTVSRVIHRTPWVIAPAPDPAARLRLIAFPYAGGGPSAFLQWPRLLPPGVELCAVQMPGREARMDEPPIVRWDDAVARLVEALTPWLDRPFALFGHSLGATLAYELARSLPGALHAGLRHLFVAGRRAPHLPPAEPLVSTLPREAFVQELKRLAGTPEELLHDPEMMEIYLPLLRADFGLADTYAHRRSAPLSAPISVYGGLSDHDVSAGDLDAWREHTAGPFRRVMFPGGHFFLHEHRAALLLTLARELRKTIEHSAAAG